MKIKLLSAMCGLLALASFSSCSQTEITNENLKPIYYLNLSSSDNFVAVQTKGESNWKYYPGIDYTLIFDENDNTCTAQFVNLQFNDNEKDRTTMTFGYIPRTSFTDPMVKGVNVTTPFQLSSGSTATYTIRDLKITCLLDEKLTFGTTEDANGKVTPKTVGPQNAISFTIDDKYLVRIIQKKNYFYGSTFSVCTDGDLGQFITRDAKYCVTLDYRSQQALMTIENAQFVSSMPTGITMTFPGIDFAMSDNGFTLNCTQLIPQANNRPFQAYEVTDLTGTVVTAQTFDLKFTCPHVPIPMTSTDTYSFDVTVDANYSLTAR